MAAIIVVGIAGILFMLGIISMQIGSLKPQPIIVMAGLIIVFILCASLAGLLVLEAGHIVRRSL